MFGGFGTSIILNSVVIYPVLNKILRADKKIPSLRHRKVVAILFLAVVGLLSVGVDLLEILQDRNLFRVLEVSRTASDKDVRVSYQRLARELHPDMNRENPNAEEDFIEMKKAYDILANPDLREAYDKWGYDGVNWAAKSEDVLSNGLLQTGISYVVWFALTILLTVNSSGNDARTISLAGLSLLLALDLQMRTGAWSIVIPFFPHLAVYQLSKLLFTVYPTFIGGTIVFQNTTFLSPAERNFHLLSMACNTQAAIYRNLATLENELRLTKSAGALPTGAVSTAGGTGAAAAAATSALPRNLRARNQQHQQQQQQGQHKAKRGIPSWAFMIGFYVLFNYILK
ncbi:DnaJ family protein [Hondaea fermentalgiana]|uniref:DnaJ family protein n=1 Tax=Hondaea fermentalgiana TaxID=2315210 RepID=A0A2R5GR92_9STRA|nr:DnaJ family protein [Hondaea fermentalgiana]|eukprot:GBG33115.1 DnaJ family protein [Hondaea fermentalgiana]